MTIVRADSHSDLAKGMLVAGLGTLILMSAIIGVGFMIKEKTQEVIRVRNLIEAQSVQADVLSRLSAEYTKAQPYAGALKTILPERDKFITFGKELEDLARSKGIAGFSFNFTGEQQSVGQLPGSFSFALTLQGESAKVIDYFDALHKTNYFIWFPGVEVAGGGGGYVMTLVGQVYMRGE